MKVMIIYIKQVINNLLNIYIKIITFLTDTSLFNLHTVMYT